MKNCVLKSFDDVVLSFSYSPEKENELELTGVFRQDVVPVRIRGCLDADTLAIWLLSRISAHGKKVLQRVEEARKLDENDPLRFLLFTHGLSLNDALWVAEEGSPLKWKDVNLYENEFPPEIAEIAFTRAGSTNECRNSPEYTSKGNMKKCWERRPDGIYLLKTDKRGPLESEIYAEFFAGQVLAALGISHVEYNLEKHRNKRRNRDELACVCPLFTSEKIGFAEAGALARYWELLTRKEKNVQFELGTRKWQLAMANKYGFDEYADMMLADFLLGNRDRHLANYGWLMDNITGGLLGPAPLFDHGQSFLAGKDFDMEDVDDLENWLDEEADISRFMDRWEQLDAFALPRHGDAVARLADIRFENHPEFPFPDDCMRVIERFVRHQAQRALEAIEMKARNAPAM